MKKFAFIFACVSLSIVCSKAKAEVNVSGSLDEIRGRLDPGVVPLAEEIRRAMM